jgi:hypothetical protein
MTGISVPRLQFQIGVSRKRRMASSGRLAQVLPRRDLTFNRPEIARRSTLIPIVDRIRLGRRASVARLS